jgi:hypothetical protein
MKRGLRKRSRAEGRFYHAPKKASNLWNILTLNLNLVRFHVCPHLANEELLNFALTCKTFVSVALSVLSERAQTEFGKYGIPIMLSLRDHISYGMSDWDHKGHILDMFNMKRPERFNLHIPLLPHFSAIISKKVFCQSFLNFHQKIGFVGQKFFWEEKAIVWEKDNISSYAVLFDHQPKSSDMIEKVLDYLRLKHGGHINFSAAIFIRGVSEFMI